MRCSIGLLYYHNVLKLVTATDIKGRKALLWQLFQMRAERRLLGTLMLSGCYKETTYIKIEKAVRIAHAVRLQASCNPQNKHQLFLY